MPARAPKILIVDDEPQIRTLLKATLGRAGYRVNDDNECEKVQDKKPVATREDAKKRDTERKQTEAKPSKPQASGQLICGNAGCRPVKSGCRVESGSSSGAGSVGYREVCP